ncbi:MAG: hypothetical protein IPP89_12495 [Saprospiraceae bacterium]|nr:hypothetical protein [Candidatus Brachybacter algidus]MBL0119771.1 hypothetical protein [Candidatus Brachybacter algidus]
MSAEGLKRIDIAKGDSVGQMARDLSLAGSPFYFKHTCTIISLITKRKYKQDQLYNSISYKSCNYLRSSFYGSSIIFGRFLLQSNDKHCFIGREMGGGYATPFYTPIPSTVPERSVRNLIR